MPIRTSSQRGFSLVESCLTIGLTGLLGLGVTTGLNRGRTDLNAAQAELRGTLEEARILARARGTSVKVGVRVPPSSDVLPVQVSPRIRWGKPAHIPLPPGMTPPEVAAATGAAHGTITITPGATATASAWFLHDGEEAVCMRLSGHGHMQVLRWRTERKRWEKV